MNEIRFGPINALCSLIGSVFHLDGLVESYAWSITVNTLANMGIGIYFIWTLFHRDPSNVARCLNAAVGEYADAKAWVCSKGFEVIRVIITIVFCIVWIFQISMSLPSFRKEQRH